MLFLKRSSGQHMNFMVFTAVKDKKNISNSAVFSAFSEGEAIDRFAPSQALVNCRCVNAFPPLLSTWPAVQMIFDHARWPVRRNRLDILVTLKPRCCRQTMVLLVCEDFFGVAYRGNTTTGIRALRWYSPASSISMPRCPFAHRAPRSTCKEILQNDF